MNNKLIALGLGATAVSLTGCGGKVLVERAFWADENGNPIINTVQREVTPPPAEGPATVMEERIVEVPNMVEIDNPKYTEACKGCGVPKKITVQRGMRKAKVMVAVPVPQPQPYVIEETGPVVAGGVMKGQSVVDPRMVIVAKKPVLEQHLTEGEMEAHTGPSALSVAGDFVGNVAKIGTAGAEIGMAFKWEPDKTNITATGGNADAEAWAWQQQCLEQKIKIGERPRHPRHPQPCRGNNCE